MVDINEDNCNIHVVAGTFVIIFLLFIGVFHSGISFSNNILNKFNNIEGYTGLEKLKEAYNLAKNETNNLYLRRIDCENTFDGMYEFNGLAKKGFFYKIVYYFWDIRYDFNTSTYMRHDWLRVTYTYGNEPFVYRHNAGKSEAKDIPLIDVIKLSDTVIDTDEAYNIAMSNLKIKDFVNQQTEINSYDSTRADLGTDLIWTFYWKVTPQKMDPKDYPGARVKIDAIRGRINYIHIDEIDF